MRENPARQREKGRRFITGARAVVSLRYGLNLGRSSGGGEDRVDEVDNSEGERGGSKNDLKRGTHIARGVADFTGARGNAITPGPNRERADYDQEKGRAIERRLTLPEKKKTNCIEEKWQGQIN